ncbi:alpha/beta hydrolase fold domain-containing protein [Nocardia blacklockiae]|uniref:alpha/beta hydrolase fold domain-containing protein n=1 Tax=Nocardia blacklockiae TaxID=480036 RepID=UPI001895BA4D|nr:alpha/beta hydrolase [Nocardia blacklockiae]MBF6171906.1 alpha/beta hydrolase [Nocardia blacklockiae]
MFNDQPATLAASEKPSLRARMMIAALRVTRAKKTFASADALHESIAKSQRPERDRPPESLYRDHLVSRREIRGRPVYTIRPRTGGTTRHVFYLHGGAYVHQIQRDHWKFLSRLIDHTGCTVTVPLYPLAPAHHYDDTVPMVVAAHDELLGDTPTQDKIFMGDSAGGALALVLARRIGAAGETPPKEVVMISPWLDVTMIDPVAEAIDPRDPYLGVAGLVEAGRLYADRHDRADPQISPLNAPAATPGRLSLFIGTRDVLLADARRFRTRCADEGVELDYHEYPGMFHAWVLADLPESRHAMRELVRLVNDEVRNTHG